MPPRCFQRTLHRLAKAGGIVGWCEKTKGLIALLKLQAVESNVALSGDLYSKVSRINSQTRVGKVKLTNFDSYAGPCLTSLDINHLAHWKMEGRDGGLFE